jgi:hypothetical protein
VNKPICYTKKCVIIVQSNTLNGQEFQQLSSIIPPNISGDKAQISDWKNSLPQPTQMITTCTMAYNKWENTSEIIIVHLDIGDFSLAVHSKLQ